MSSIVRDLQTSAIGSDIPISELLRKGLIVAKRLDLDEFENWIRKELNGYKPDDELPKYRVPDGQLKATNPMTGANIPVLVKDDELAELFSHGYLRQPAAELASIVKDADDKHTLILPLPPKMSNAVAPGKNPHVEITTAQVTNILESIRNIILDWCLKLEDEGIIGEDSKFSNEEIQKAQTNIFNIKNVHGDVFGSVEGEIIQMGNFNELNSSLEETEVEDEEREEILEVLTELKDSEEPEDKEALAKRASKWTIEHSDKIGALSETIRQWIMYFS